MLTQVRNKEHAEVFTAALLVVTRDREQHRQITAQINIMQY